MPMFVISLFPTIDIASDLNYAITTRFFSSTLLLASVISITVPNLYFFRVVATVHSQRSNERAYPSMLVKSYPGLWFHKNILWFAIADGYPVNPFNNLPWKYFNEHDSIPKLLILGIQWVLLIGLQVAAVLVYIVWACLAICFLFVWLLVGIWVFQSKVLSTRHVWNTWFRVWTGGDQFDKTIEIDVAILNGSIFAEFMCETLPQICVQALNNELTGIWDPFGYFSMMFSVIMASDGTYRYLYWVVGRGKAMHEVPAEVSLMGFFPVTLEYEAQALEARKAPNPSRLKALGEKLWDLLFTRKDKHLVKMLLDAGIESAEQLSVVVEPQHKQLLADITEAVADDTRVSDLLHKYVKKHKQLRVFLGKEVAEVGAEADADVEADADADADADVEADADADAG